jgi:hypothetical protein
MAKTVGLTFEENIPTEICEVSSPDGKLGIGVNLSDMTVVELKAYAAEMGIDLTGASKKDDIISRILEPAEV